MRKRGLKMSREEKKQFFENLTEKFVRMDENSKAFIAGYITGKQEERQKQGTEHEVPVA